MKEFSNNMKNNIDRIEERHHVKDCKIEKFAFQNEDFGKRANNKLNSYINELNGIVGIEELEDTIRVEYDSEVISENEVREAANKFKKLF